MELYRVRSRKATFRLHHCWLIQKDAPKWQETMPSSVSKSTKACIVSLSESNGVRFECSVDNVIKAPTLTSIRSLGNKKAKAKSQAESGILKVQTDMVKAIVERNAIARDNGQLKMFTVRVDPDDVEASAFIAAKRRSAMLDVELEIETKRQKLIALRRANDDASSSTNAPATESTEPNSDNDDA
ncbi:hypothetical protein, variant 2 [Aphanomyces astaci]|uniref:No apical meristem-associated C-terminal domain-containing protein n=1 Tax=Aphanomyces astaci TaxID=112090 RepID=W4FL66_APHAT|nr:hypothetical protein, variant 3 [Aphanomyces astaci]XP_009842210.1 hypothetical protein, variant 2 [Aphanomyces astaci]ETV68266.1 hypothetical protein, variant 2 [Aphanomyces astaci]ETV68267.1 hypothetical protein, variant 3 [Aphanomyces astaci]|eukprot:XP_009842209.1 hypothetical protein, variant 3 [Aphanomyces astaci]